MNSKQEILLQNTPQKLYAETSKKIELINTNNVNVCLLGSHLSNINSIVNQLFGEKVFNQPNPVYSVIKKGNTPKRVYFDKFHNGVNSDSSDVYSIEIDSNSDLLSNGDWVVDCIDNTERVTNRDSIIVANRFVHVIGSINITQADNNFWEYYKSMSLNSSNLMILVSDANTVTSQLLLTQNLKTVLERYNLEPVIIFDNQESWKDTVIKFCSSVSGTKNISHNYTSIARDVLDYWIEQQNIVNKQIEWQKNRNTEFVKLKERFLSYQQEALTKLWVSSFNLDEGLDSDCDEFAKETLEYITTQIKNVDDLKSIYYFVPGYVNMVWGEFIKYETKQVFKIAEPNLEKVWSDILSDFNKLFSIYNTNSDSTLKERKMPQITNPIIGDGIDLSHPATAVTAFLIELIWDHLLIHFTSGVGYFIKPLRNIGVWLASFVNFQISADEQKKRILNGIYEQFTNGLPEIKKQVKESIVPLIKKELENTFLQSISPMVYDVEILEKELDDELMNLKTKKEGIQTKIDNINEVIK